MTVQRRGLTAKQQHALDAALPHLRAQLSKAFHAQLDQRARAAPAPQRQRVNLGNLNRMPRGANSRGSMPDMSKGNWAQTPASSNVVAPRGFGYYDAFEHDPFSVATHMSIGPATPIVGSTVVSEGLVTRAPLAIHSRVPAVGPQPPGVGLEGGAMLLIIQPAPSDVQAVLFFSSNAGDATTPVYYAEDGCQSRLYSSPQFEADAPDNAIPTRCSMRIRNWTQAVGVGGVVRVLRLTTGMALHSPQTTNGGLAILMEGIRNHTRTRVYGGDELSACHQKNCTVVDQSKSTWFTDWDRITPVDQVPWAMAAGWGSEGYAIDAFTLALHDPAYTPIAILFEPFVAAVSGGVVGNTYEVSIRSQFLGHYAQGTILANMAVNPPTAPGPLTQHRNKEEEKGSTMERITNTIRQGASWAWNHSGDLVSALGAIGPATQMVRGAARYFGRSRKF
jgi:hypothetical protein